MFVVAVGTRKITILSLGVPPLLSGFVGTFHPAALVQVPSTPSTLLSIYIELCHVVKTKINKKRPRLADLKNKSI